MECWCIGYEKSSSTQNGIEPKKVAEFDAGYLKDFQTGRKLFEMDGSYVKLYSSGKKVAEIDGNYLKDYQTGKKLAEFNCPGHFSALAAAYYFF